jgi:predicted transcriptional regulator
MRRGTILLVNEKIEILVYILTNPCTTSNQLNFHSMIKNRSKKTTSSIYRYVRELISDGYLAESGSKCKKLSITRKGRVLLDSLSSATIKDRKKPHSVNVIIITLPAYCMNYNSLNSIYLRRKYYGGSFY